MDEKLYDRLRKHLDDQPGGLPKTESGAEIDILKRFYTPEQAQIALKVSMIPESASKIAKKIKMDLDITKKKLSQMARNGLLFRFQTSKGTFYFQTSFIMGVYEYHVDRIDQEIAQKVDEVYAQLFRQHWKDKRTKQLRVVPVNTSIEKKDHVYQYNRIKKLVKNKDQKPISLAPCICRIEAEKKGTSTGRPLETCLAFGVAAQYYIDNGIGRKITEKEFLDKLDECEKDGLVPLSSNSKKIVNLCMCDKHGCQILKNIKKFKKPASQFHSGYVAKLDQEACIGCGICKKRCQMEAIAISGYKKNNTKIPVYLVNENLCIGCGLCITSCPSGSVQLVDREDKLEIPETFLAMNIAMAKERGHLKGLLPYAMIKWLLKLILDNETANIITSSE